jgi:predicted house-cleaning NTP pyrophosphatase (Maf/HAM1 superfamily)
VSPPPKVHLASASERRASWLEAYFEASFEEGSVEFSAGPLLTEEMPPEYGISVKEQVEQTLSAKVEAAKFEFSLAAQAGREIPDLILVADTLVEDPDDSQVSLGQPADRAAAVGMLLRLNGRRHLVWSGVALIRRGESGWLVDSHLEFATVEIDELSVEELAALLDSESWVGKAGGYDIAGQMGAHARVVAGEEVCVIGLAAAAIEALEESIEGRV